MNIKKIIKEEIDNFDWIDQSGVETPLSWLIDNFGDLTPVVKDDKTFYVDGDNKRLFYYYQDGNCYISDGKIWSVLRSHFGINNAEVKEVTTIWLEEVYGLVGLTPEKRKYIEFGKFI
jgi:hypothetical protein